MASQGSCFNMNSVLLSVAMVLIACINVECDRPFFPIQPVCPNIHFSGIQTPGFGLGLPSFESGEKQAYEIDPERTIDTFSSGIDHLLGGSDLAEGHKVLCLQVVLDVDHDKFKRKFEETTGAGSSTEDALGIVADYSKFWVQSCSIVFETVNDLHNKIRSFDFQGREKAKGKHSKNCCTEVTLFILANGDEISDENINNREQLIEFLEDLGQVDQDIQKVHITSSSVKFVRKEKQGYSHLKLAGSLT